MKVRIEFDTMEAGQHVRIFHDDIDITERGDGKEIIFNVFLFAQPEYIPTYCRNIPQGLAKLIIDGPDYIKIVTKAETK